jgi:hypothetical protein
MAVNGESQQPACRFLRQLVRLARLPDDTEVLVYQIPFAEALRQAPTADLSIFGLSRKSNMAFSQRIIEIANGSCIFVRDSGEESALA